MWPEAAQVAVGPRHAVGHRHTRPSPLIIASINVHPHDKLLQLPTEETRLEPAGELKTAGFGRQEVTVAVTQVAECRSLAFQSWFSTQEEPGLWGCEPGMTCDRAPLAVQGR